MDRFENKSLPAASGQFTRYFAPWKVQEYLVSTGDHSAWVRFTADSLRSAVAEASSRTTFPACVSLAVTNSSASSSPSVIQTMFLQKGYDMFLGPWDVRCGLTEVSA